MSKYRTEDGTIVDTDKAASPWNEEKDWNGSNWISRATGDQWTHQTLYKSSKGRYYIEHESQWQGATPSAEFVSDEEAARWLVLNEHELPEDLVEAAEAVTE